MITKDNTCQDCGMQFQRSQDLLKHQSKFCLNSKYANIETLEKQFKQASKHRDISMYGNPAIAMKGKAYDFEQQKQKASDLDREYKKILKEINDEKTYKNKMQNEKQLAYRELQALQKQQQELVIDNKKKNLQDIIKQRENLLREEDQLQKQLRNYQAKKREWEKSGAKVQRIEDYPYQQGIKAGKLNQERGILQERKKDIQYQMKKKRKQYERMEQQLLKADLPEYLPQIRSEKPFIKTQPKIQKQEKSLQVSKVSRGSNRTMKTQTNKSFHTIQPDSYLKPTLFSGEEKMLKFNLNREGKSQEDKIIQSVMAQEYDDLKILSKLPKGSELYNTKLRQYQELSRARMEAQEKANQLRVDKMRRQFEYEKKMVKKDRQNAKWVDENRKALVTRQLGLLNPDKLGEKQQFGQQREEPMIPQIQSNQYFQPPTREHIPSTKQHIPSKQTILQEEPRPSIRDNLGYKILIVGLKNYPHKKPVKVKTILYEEWYHKEKQGMKYEFSTVYHDENAGSQSDPFNPNFKNKLDRDGTIAYNQSFYVTENLQKLYNRNQMEIYLLILVAEKDEKKITNEPKPYCWYSFKVTHFGKLREGRFTFNLYGDDMIYPYPADMNRMKRRKQEEVIIELEEVLIDRNVIDQINRRNQPPVPPTIQAEKLKSINSISSRPFEQKQKTSFENVLEQQRKQTPSKKSTVKSFHKVEKTKDQEVKNYPFILKQIDKERASQMQNDEFFSNEKKTIFKKVSLKEALNFDIQISGLRTLPSYIGPVKLQISFIDVDSMSILEKEQCLAEIGSDMENPNVSFLKKVRSQTRIPPSTVIFIRIITFSALDYQIYTLGFSIFYLFMDESGNPIINNRIDNYLLATGYYQIPIFWGSVEPKYMSPEQVTEDYPPIPCSTLLISILQNKSNITNPMPPYSSHEYNTILFPIEELEARLFTQQYKRQPTDTNQLISGYLQYKGINKDYSGQEVNKYLFKSLNFSRQNTRYLLKLNWMSQYEDFFGVAVSLDKISVPKTKKKYYYFITTCLCPPAEYYKEKTFDLNFAKKIDIQKSTTSEIFFDDGDFLYNIPYNRNTSLIVELNRVQVFEEEGYKRENNIEGLGYTILPLFQLGEVPVSVQVRKAEVQLCDGEFQPSGVEKLENDIDWFLKKIQKASKSQFTISFRVLNGFFTNQFKPHSQKMKGTLYKSIAPEGKTFSSALGDVAQVLSSNYNLQIQ